MTLSLLAFVILWSFASNLVFHFLKKKYLGVLITMVATIVSEAGDTLQSPSQTAELLSVGEVQPGREAQLERYHAQN